MASNSSSPSSQGNGGKFLQLSRFLYYSPKGMLNEIRGKATEEKTVRDRTDARSCKLSTVLKYSRGLVCMTRQKLRAKKLINQ